ncbi:BrnA antitoxin family protein [Sulfitobacter albidus]|uniref:BrnA antitoxin family protein n=1 Tax=Sulfitobacter albidus TaxID=2829501 RepID=A0A975JBP8_9RHOB|nr:BrnA antitoxin family protein [Sulfitobacter albidus]QUJ75496.1 BrnA antitoxin family protein [Sulfitobacter albidus]
MAVRSPVKQAHRNYFNNLMMQIEWDLHQTLLDEKRIPDDWHKIARGRMPQKKTRITLRVEEDVVKFFRRMGPGYQQRMNDVLAAWMQGRLAALIDGPDARDLDAEAFGSITRPRLGDVELLSRGLARDADGVVRDMETGEAVEE